MTTVNRKAKTPVELVARNNSACTEVENATINLADASARNLMGSSTCQRIVYLMRGLPSCGKSYRAKQLAGATGVVCETDEFFHTQVGDQVDKYNYAADRQQEARDWNFNRFTAAVDAGVSTIVVDRGNGLNVETQRYARYAVDGGYTVLLTEPDSPWWQEIRVLLKYKEHTGPILDDWAVQLANKNRSTHRTPVKTIRKWMQNWNHSITVEAILNYKAPMK